MILASFRSQAGKDYEKYLPEIAMGFFIVKGYKFDDSDGDFIPMPTGEILLDYIVEKPVAFNAERLSIIWHGGNADRLSELMLKHGTAARWSELLKIIDAPLSAELAKLR